MPFLARQGGSVFYNVMGKGEPVVLVRGLGRSTKHWLGWDEKISKHFKVVTIDARGVGQSTLQPKMGHTLFELSGDIKDVLDEVGIEKAHVFGVSLGGMVAMACGLSFPERLKSLIIVNSSLGGSLWPRLSFRAAKALIIGGFFDKNRLHDLLADSLLSPVKADEKYKKDISAKWKLIAEEEGVPQAAVGKQLCAALRFRHREDLRKMMVPSLVLCGTKDLFVPRDNSQTIAKILPSSRLVFIENGGHELTNDSGDEVLAELQKWVAARK